MNRKQYRYLSITTKSNMNKNSAIKAGFKSLKEAKIMKERFQDKIDELKWKNDRFENLYSIKNSIKKYCYSKSNRIVSHVADPSFSEIKYKYEGMELKVKYDYYNDWKNMEIIVDIQLKSISMK